jgi:hypothetical protein
VFLQKDRKIKALAQMCAALHADRCARRVDQSPYRQAKTPHRVRPGNHENIEPALLSMNP